MLENTKIDRPERRTALVARFKVDIAALQFGSETRFTDKGQLSVTGVGYTFWSGRSSEERREAGVGFLPSKQHIFRSSKASARFSTTT